MRPLIAAAILAGLATPACAMCIDSRQIDHTSRPNDKTIVFYMNDHQVYRNDLPVRCPNLSTTPDGITLVPTDPSDGEICPGMATIRVNSPANAACIIGKFTRLK
jgi:hypothetical protein